MPKPTTQPERPPSLRDLCDEALVERMCFAPTPELKAECLRRLSELKRAYAEVTGNIHYNKGDNSNETN